MQLSPNQISALYGRNLLPDREYVFMKESHLGSTTILTEDVYKELNSEVLEHFPIRHHFSYDGTIDMWVSEPDLLADSPAETAARTGRLNPEPLRL